MAIFRWIDERFRELPTGEAMLWITAGNFAILALAVSIGLVLVRACRRPSGSLPPASITRGELLLAITCALINSVITLVGLVLWKAGFILVRHEENLLLVAVDFLVLFLVMDLAMYVLHRTAHHPWFYGWLHRTHHTYENPRPLTLFVMNPLEVVAFGALWLTLITIYSPSWPGMGAYLTLNVAFGTIGHLGVEPFPRGWVRWPLVKYVATSTFHRQHHQNRERNLGFYTLVWDRFFGTLSPDYERTMADS